MTSPRLHTDQIHSLICAKISLNSSISPYHTIEQILPPQNESQSFWWHSTGSALATLLEKAGGRLESNVRSLLFYYLNIIPYLGEAPKDILPDGGKSTTPIWKSFMTDDHTPVELSWSWGDGCEAPVIRFSFEPIGPQAGTNADPLNAHAAFDFMNELRQILPYLDLKWFDHFSDTLLSFSDISMTSEERPGGNKSRVFLAFDLLETRVTPKAYFFPGFKAVDMGRDTMDVISDAIKSLPNNHTASAAFPGFPTLYNFVKNAQVEVDMLAIDCVEPAAARLKFYVRNRSTSWQSVQHMVTLGGANNGLYISKGLEELELLWMILFRLDDELPADEELAYKDHRTAGILYNFELRPGSSTIVPKVYIPVRHYMKSDSRIMQRLKIYLKIRGWDFTTTERYPEAMKQLL